MNKIASNRFFISFYFFENFKRIPVIAVQAVLGAEPHKAQLVLQTAGNAVIGQAIFHLKMSEIMRACMQ